MVPLSVISQKVDLAKAYYAQLIAAQLIAVKGGLCYHQSDKVICLNRLIRALTWDISGDYNTVLTQKLYKLLSVTVSTYSGAYLPYDPNVVINGMTVIIAPGDIMQTSVVYPTEGVTTYTFAELIGQEVLSVYRGTGTVLRAQTGAPTDEYAQINYTTGQLTFLYAFNEGESLWVEYKTT